MGTQTIETLKEAIFGHRQIYHMRMDLDGAGLGAIILHVISLLRYCERENLYPVVDFDADCVNAYFDPQYGNNTWHQYFEPVQPISSDELRSHIKELENQSLIHRLSSDEAKKICVEHDDSVYSFTFGRWRDQHIPKVKEPRRARR